MSNKTKKKQYNQSRQDFLLTFFDCEDYQEKFVNGFWLIKQFNGDTDNWQVAIFTKDSFKSYSESRKKSDVLKREDEMKSESMKLEEKYLTD